MDNYIGKHDKKWYRVWRVIGPAGPEVTTYIFGREEAEKLCEGCWDWEISPITVNTKWRELRHEANVVSAAGKGL